MCGILGANFQHKNFLDSLHSLQHRGQDNSNVKIVNNNSFGHNRLAIIDLDNEANQPMSFNDITITFNGEIYNYKELIQSEKLICKTKSDTEVIIRLYEKYGQNFLHLLNGMFSFCIYDRKKEKYFCARDRFGKKPFYYYHKNNKFIYASEIKAILKLLDKQPDFNQDVLHEYLMFWSTISQETFFKDIYKLKAGESLTFENNILKTDNYYDLASKNSDFDYDNEKELLEDIEDSLIESVQLRLVGDQEVASLLSGGIDSSIISAIYSKLSNKKINTFCIGYDQYDNYNELKYANIVAKDIKSNHHELIINKNIFTDSLECILQNLDEPIADSAMVPTYIISKEIASQNIKVALTGEGSDEIFLGYDRYFQRLKENDTSTIMINQAFSNIQLNSLLTYPHKDIEYKMFQQSNLSTLQQFTYNDFNTWIAENLMGKLDRMSMLNTLELRAPFLDYNLVEKVFKIDDSTKSGNNSKYLLKQIALKYLPESIVNRRKKGFSSPSVEWLYEVYKNDILDTIIYVNKETNFFNSNEIILIFNNMKDGKNKQQLWSIYIFCRWFKKEFL